RGTVQKPQYALVSVAVRESARRLGIALHGACAPPRLQLGLSDYPRTEHWSTLQAPWENSLFCAKPFSAIRPVEITWRRLRTTVSRGFPSRISRVFRAFSRVSEYSAASSRAPPAPLRPRLCRS